MPELVVLVGNVGSGKTEISKEYAKKGHVVVDKDFLREMVGAGKYVFNKRYEPLLNYVAGACIGIFLKHGYDVVVDSCNMSIVERVELVQLANMLESTPICHVTPKISKEDCIARRMKNARGFDEERWTKVYDEMEKQYTIPSTKEGFKEIRGVEDAN